MGWGDCGVNSTTGEPMGYCHSGTCHHPDCNNIIDHGLAYVCGGMHEGGEDGCGYYFCSSHLYLGTGRAQLCEQCMTAKGGQARKVGPSREWLMRAAEAEDIYGPPTIGHHLFEE